MTSIIWGVFGLTLILIVAVGALIQYIKDREKYKKTEDDDWNKMVVIEAPSISEPATSFLKCFKDNPKRFKVAATTNRACFELRDILVSKRWLFSVTKERSYGVKVGFSTECKLIILDTGLGWLTKEEKATILSTLSPYFVTERRDRLHAIQRERLSRIYKETP